MSFAFASVGGSGGFFDGWPQEAPANCALCEQLNEQRSRVAVSVWSRGARAAIISQLQSGDVFAVMNTDNKFSTSQSIEAQRAFLSNLADDVADKGTTLLIIWDTPTLPLSAESCYLRDDVS